MKEVLSRIRQADDLQLNEIIDAVIQRYGEVYPQWEIMFLSLPRNDPEACLRELERISRFIRRNQK